jgi:hypothetical protein
MFLISVLILAMAAWRPPVPDLREMAFRDQGPNSTCSAYLKEWRQRETGRPPLPPASWAGPLAPILKARGCPNMAVAAATIASRSPAVLSRAPRYAETPDPRVTPPPPPQAPEPPESALGEDVVRFADIVVPTNLAVCGGDGAGWIEVYEQDGRAIYVGSAPVGSSVAGDGVPGLGTVLTFDAAAATALYTGAGPCILVGDVSCHTEPVSGRLLVAGRTRFASAGFAGRSRWQLCVIKQG